MTEIAQLEQNVRVADLLEPMTAAQRARFIEAFIEFSHGEGLCTTCRYCAGSCPVNLQVPTYMATYQLYDIFGVKSVAPQIAALTSEKDPANCTACGTCVEKCPQKLPIPDRMERLAAIVAELNRA
jgi:predicted aldo/keto reductase-like oxidoreductase